MNSKFAQGDSLDELFGLWEKAHNEETDEHYRQYYQGNDILKGNFCHDGFIDEARYKMVSHPVLFVGKECNISNSVGQLCREETFWASKVVKEANENHNSKTSNPFLKGIAMLYNDYLACINNPHAAIIPQKKTDKLCEVAFINLNKRGGYHYCVWDTLKNYVDVYREYIAKQIDIINPETIICCGPSVRYLIENYELGIGRKLVTAYHPSYMFNDHDKICYFRQNLFNCENEWGREKQKMVKHTVRECRGVIFDTNNRYGNAEETMLVNHRISAFSDARHYLNVFQEGDYVFYYSTKLHGVIAAGIIKGTLQEDDQADEAWFDVEPIHGAYPVDPCNTKLITIGEVKEVLSSNENYKGGWWSATVKYPYLSMEQSKKVIDKFINAN